MIFNITYLTTFKPNVRNENDKPTTIRHYDVPLRLVERDIAEMQETWTLLNVELTLQHHYLDAPIKLDPPSMEEAFKNGMTFNEWMDACK
jgi:hypothetical protein